MEISKIFYDAIIEYRGQPQNNETLHAERLYLSKRLK